jgi:16S rRNA (uracil1498-N3)-methyltransferase
VVGELRDASHRPVRAVTLLQGVGKGDKLDAVVRDATELAATTILPFIGSRSVAQRTSEAAMTRLRRVALDAARQSGRGDLPRIVPPSPLADALRIVDADVRFVLVPGGASTLGQRLQAIAPRASVALLVGPEGGLTDDEVGLAEAHAFVRVGLGVLVLRTETAATAALGAVAAWTAP